MPVSKLLTTGGEFPEMTVNAPSSEQGKKEDFIPSMLRMVKKMMQMQQPWFAPPVSYNGKNYKDHVYFFLSLMYFFSKLKASGIKPGPVLSTSLT